MKVQDYSSVAAAVASNVTESDIAFCILYNFGYRLTWAILPWSIVALSWLTVIPRFKRLQLHVVSPLTSSTIPTISGSVQLGKDQDVGESDRRMSSLSQECPEDEEREEKLIPGLKIFDKITLGLIWFLSFVYSILTDHILSKQVDLPCNINHDIYNKFGLVSIILAIIVPTVIGPLSIFFLHIFFSFANMILHTTTVSEEAKKQEQTNLICIFSLTVVFLLTYITSMIISEVYIDLEDVFHFVLVKYIAGRQGWSIKKDTDFSSKGIRTSLKLLILCDINLILILILI